VFKARSSIVNHSVSSAQNQNAADTSDFSGRGAAFHRAQFRGAIADHVVNFPQVEICFNKRVTEIVQNIDGTSELCFADGTKASSDIVVGYVLRPH